MSFSPLKLKHEKHADEIAAQDFQQSILNWYRENARVLPWRAGYGCFPDPYHEWLSEIMLQQTVVKTVVPYFLKFIDKWPTVFDLAAASIEDVFVEWAGLGYYSRAQNLYKCAQIIVSEYEGKFPKNENELIKLPGIGSYTAAAIASIAFGQSAVVMDGNIERIMARLHAHKFPLKESKKILYQYIYDLTQNITYPHAGDFAQGLMDLGAGVCTPRNPKCSECPVQCVCQSYNSEIQNCIPVKGKKVKKPIKYGILYFIMNDQGEMLFERRNRRGLFAGMVGLPGSEWVDNESDVLSQKNDVVEEFEIKHIFTHFELRLKARILEKNEILLGDNVFWYRLSDYDKLGLPGLYKKALEKYIKSKK